MKTSFAAIAFSLASVAYSQSISDLPSCSLNCFVSTLSGDGCPSLTDFECHCKVPGLTDQITPCVQKACSTADQATVAQQVVALCSQYGVSLSVPAVSSTAAPSSSAAASSAPASSSAAATTTESASATPSSAESSASASATSTVTSSPSATDVVVSTPVATPTTPGASTPAGGSTPTPSQFEGAAPTAGVVGGMVGLAVAVAAVAGL
ncbi:proline-rich antigen [Macrophomina phaseolina]|uniref:Proline-rich antigen n=1 Tax=Macrophomina phaseolina TaxID=35725 RepID=A0ABQ8FUX9_9PEZI|nr:proline-rich antigen [Macrophomina phaseolina]